ncbi:deazapurine DNA modification protein DpdA family protein [Amycolatopsis sp. TRM77291]
MRFFLGTHQPAWLARDLRVPLLVSHQRLAGRRTLPRALGQRALDSGGSPARREPCHRPGEPLRVEVPSCKASAGLCPDRCAAQTGRVRVA